TNLPAFDRNQRQTGARECEEIHRHRLKSLLTGGVRFSPYKPGVAGSIPAPPTTAIAASRLTFPAARLRDLHLALGLGAGSGAGSFLGRAGEALLDAGDIGLIIAALDDIVRGIVRNPHSSPPTEITNLAPKLLLDAAVHEW